MKLKNGRWIGWLCVLMPSGAFLFLTSPFYNFIWGSKSLRNWALAIQKICNTGRGLSIDESMQVSKLILFFSDLLFDLFLLVFFVFFGVFFMGIKIIRRGLGNSRSKNNVDIAEKINGSSDE